MNLTDLVTLKKLPRQENSEALISFIFLKLLSGYFYQILEAGLRTDTNKFEWTWMIKITLLLENTASPRQQESLLRSLTVGRFRGSISLSSFHLFYNFIVIFLLVITCKYGIIWYYVSMIIMKWQQVFDNSQI